MTDPDGAAVAHFAQKLRFETDVADVAAARGRSGGFTLVDSRGDAAWEQGRLPGAIHLPSARIPTEAAALVPIERPVVVYCWGPGCNGATRAALAFAEAGYRVREMIGGYEYWVREGLPTETDAGAGVHAIDPLTAPRVDCAC